MSDKERQELSRLTDYFVRLSEAMQAVTDAANAAAEAMRELPPTNPA